ncbi:MAG: GNAT family N-acyltransferase [Aliishimia sp.]
MSTSIEFEKDGYQLSLAQNADDLRDAQRLRYDVFITELGGQGPGVDHAARIEQDAFDAVSDHLILRDNSTDEVIGVYRVLRSDQVCSDVGFYSNSEYDLGPLVASGRNLLELGRSCVHHAHRNGPAMFHLWTGLARYIQRHKCEILFGVASLQGTEISEHAAALSLLHHRHRAPDELCPRAKTYQPMGLIPEAQLDRRAAMVAIPPLIKAYLRLGGVVGDGAFVDTAFNCTDVCMIMDTAQINKRQTRRFAPELA